MPKIELKGLKGLYDLPSEEYRRWLDANRAYLPKYSTRAQKEQLYNTQRFANTYGIDATRRFNYDQRLAIEKAELKRQNDNLVRETVYNWANPFRDDGTVDTNKGTGNASRFYEIMGLEPENQKALYESGHMLAPAFKKFLEDQEKAYNKAYDTGMSGAPTYSQATLGLWKGTLTEQEKTLKTGTNDKLYNQILNKDIATKSARVQPQIDKEEAELGKIKDENILPIFLKTIFPDKNSEYMGIPQLAAFYNEDGTPRSSEVSSLDPAEMRKVIARSRVYSQTYDKMTAYKMLDKEAKDYLDDHQSFREYMQALGKDMIIGGGKYTASKINGLRAIINDIKDADAQRKGIDTRVEVWVDKEGNLYGNDKVHKVSTGPEGSSQIIDVYEDPSGEMIPVTRTKASRRALESAGIDSDGNTRGWFFNNKYWSDAEATGTFDRKEQAKAKALDGYSPYKAVYKLGEEKDTFWEVVKMGQFAFSDVAAGSILSGGTGLGLKLASYTGGKAATAAMRALGTAIYAPSKTAQMISPYAGAFGISNDYGTSKFTETLASNISAIDNYYYNTASENFHNSYNNSEDFRKQVDGIVEDKVNQALSEIDPAQLNSLTEEEKKSYIASLREQALRETASETIENDVREMKELPEHTERVTNAAENAANAAYNTMWEIGLKYSWVNTHGHRAYLHQDPLKRVSSASSKVLQGIKEGVDKKLSIPMIFKNATKGVKATEVAKVIGSQLWGGGWTNYTDELQSKAASKIAEDRMGRYLDGEYDANAYHALFTSTGLIEELKDINSRIQGYEEAAAAEQTVNAFVVGALGSVTSFTPNLAALGSSKFRAEFKDAYNKWKSDKKGSARDMLRALARHAVISNGIINGYYDKVLGEEEAANVIEKINKMIDNKDDYDVIKKALALDLASLDFTNPNDKDAADYIKAVQIIQNLKNFTDTSSPLEVGAAQRSSVLKEALDDVDKILNGQLTDSELKDHLVEYYAKNRSVIQSKANDTRAINVIRENAQKLREGYEVFSKVDNILSNVERKNKQKISPLVRATLVERFALDQFLNKRIEDVEESITGSRAITASSSIESYGTQKSIEKAANAFLTEASYKKAAMESLEKDRDAKQKKADDYLNDRDIEDLTDQEREEYFKLRRKADAANLEIKVAEQYYKNIEKEASRLQEAVGSEEGRVLSSDEILRLAPRERARMLDEDNLDNYSQEQQEEILKAINELTLKDPELLQAVQDQATLVARREGNSRAYSMMLSNPEAAAGILEAATSDNAYRRVVDNAEMAAVERAIQKLEEVSGVSDDELRAAIKKQLGPLRFGLLMKMAMSDSPIFKKYANLIGEAITANSIMDNVTDALDKLGIEGDSRADIQQRVGRALENKTSINNVIQELQDYADSNPGNAEIPSVIGELTRVWRIDQNYDESQKTIQTNRTKAAIEEQRNADAHRSRINNSLNVAIRLGKHIKISYTNKSGETLDRVLSDVKYKGDNNELIEGLDSRTGKKTTFKIANIKSASVIGSNRATADNTTTQETAPSQQTPQDTTKEEGHLTSSNSEEVRSFLINKGLLEEGKPIEFIVNFSDGGKITNLQAEVIRRRLRTALENPNCTWGDVIKTVLNNSSSKTKINNAGVEFLHKLLDSYRSKEINIDDFMNVVEAMFDIKSDESTAQSEESTKETEESKEEAVETPAEEVKEDTESTEEIDTTVHEVSDDNYSSDIEEAPSTDELVEKDIDEAIKNGAVIPPNVSRESDDEIAATGVAQDGEFVGNYFSRYRVVDGQVLLREETENVTGNLAAIFKWFDSANIKYQEVIDNELSRIAELDPDVRILRVAPRNNATNDMVMRDVYPLVVEYTEDVAKIHKGEDSIVEANNQKWLVIGALGINTSARISSQNQKYKALTRNHGKLYERTFTYFKEHPDARFYVDDVAYTKISQVNPGRLVTKLNKSDIEDSEGTKIPRRQPVSSLLEEVGLELRDAVWGIATYQGLQITSRVDSSKVLHPKSISDRAGTVYLLIPTTSGRYITTYIAPSFTTDLKEGSKLAERINNAFTKLISDNHKDRYDALTTLSQYLYLNKSDYNINIGTKDNPTLTITIKGNTKEYSLADPNISKINLLTELKNSKFRIQVSVPALTNRAMLNLYDEAGVLLTDIKKYGTSAADFSVYDMDENGTPNIPENREPKEYHRSSRPLGRNSGNNVLYKGKIFSERPGGWSDLDGNTITDPVDVRNLNYLREINQGKAPSSFDGLKNYYIFDADLNNPKVVTVIGTDGNTIKELGKEEAINYINEQSRIAEEKAREEAIKEELEKLEKEQSKTEEDSSTEEEDTDNEVTQDDIEAFLFGKEEEESVDEDIDTENPDTELTEEPITKEEQTKDPNKMNYSKPLEGKKIYNSIEELMLGEMDRFLELIEYKTEKGEWEDIPSDDSEALTEFLIKKRLPVTNIDADTWFDIAKNCR